MATVNLFKKVADYMKKHPNVSRKDAFAIVQGKKKVSGTTIYTGKDLKKYQVKTGKGTEYVMAVNADKAKEMVQRMLNRTGSKTKILSAAVINGSPSKKRRPSSPLVRQGAPVKVVKTTVKKKVSLGSVSPGKFALDKLNTEYKYLKQFEEKIEIAKAQVKTEKNPADKRAAQRSLDYYKELLRITKLNISNLKRSIR